MGKRTRRDLISSIGLVSGVARGSDPLRVLCWVLRGWRPDKPQCPGFQVLPDAHAPDRGWLGIGDGTTHRSFAALSSGVTTAFAVMGHGRDPVFRGDPRSQVRRPLCVYRSFIISPARKRISTRRARTITNARNRWKIGGSRALEQLKIQPKLRLKMDRKIGEENSENICRLTRRHP